MFKLVLTPMKSGTDHSEVQHGPACLYIRLKRYRVTQLPALVSRSGHWKSEGLRMRLDPLEVTDFQCALFSNMMGQIYARGYLQCVR